MKKTKHTFPSQKEIMRLSRFVLRKKNKDINKLKRGALAWLKMALNNKLDYEVNWLGIPAIQNPYDMVRTQEIIFNLRPDVVIETGIAHGGSLIFYASILELLGKGKVVGVDIDIRKHNKNLIIKHPLFKRITLIEGSSTDNRVIRNIKKIIGNSKRVLVLLDSSHTHEHVLKELELYSPLVSKGSYIIVFDTIVEYMPPEYSSNRPWGHGNNPYTAVKEFLRTHKNFIVDRDIENKTFITVAPGGYLKRIR